MTDRHPPLHPWPLRSLLERVDAEWRRHGEIFGLAGRRFFKPDPQVDLGMDLGGRRIATPVGPAAGPHTQLAANLALGWLAGARSFELKTVQILDELDIPRPCIDMENVGYNVEWSQELTLDESLAEYVKGWLLLAVLREWGPLREALGDPGDHAFELSVGYDLAGIQSERMTSFIAGLRDAGAAIDRMRAEIPGAFAAQRDAPAAGDIVHTATLSTFHGCPPDEIEAIVRHLMTAHGLDVTVKLNPTLLGPETVSGVLHDRLGYRDVALVPEAFAEDLQWDRALAMIDRLQEFARAEGREFGLKLTNTLVVENRRGVMPGERMYLSGKPLHVLATTLLDRLHAALPGRLRLGEAQDGIPVAFSAGIDKDNVADAVGLGLAPVTICSDLLRPGGYGRMAQGLRKLVKDMQREGVTDLAGWRAHAGDRARRAGHADAVAAAGARLTTAAGAKPYTLAATDKPLRQVDNDLRMFDCVACTNCVTVCPNNAFLQVDSPAEAGYEARAQYLVLAELCNDCGNCTTFCPERGSPQVIKPRLYAQESAWRGAGEGAFLVREDGSVAGEAEAAAKVRDLVAQAGWWPGGER